MAKKTTKKNNPAPKTTETKAAESTELSQEEILKNARKKKASERNEAEQAAIANFREQKRADRQTAVTAAITKAVALNSSIMSAATSPTLVGRIEGLRDSMVAVETVRAEVRENVRQKAVLPSIEAIIDEANNTAQTAWAKALEEISALETSADSDSE